VGQIESPDLTLDVYYKLGKEKSYVYEDAQDGYDYNKGRYSYKTFTLNGKENELLITQHKEGTFETQYQTIKIALKCLPFKIKKIEIDNEVVDLENLSFVENSLQIDKDFTEIHIFGA
jgi:alpha-glucosidase